MLGAIRWSALAAFHAGTIAANADWERLRRGHIVFQLFENVRNSWPCRADRCDKGGKLSAVRHSR